jgi:hypothetical protein
VGGGQYQLRTRLFLVMRVGNVVVGLHVFVGRFVFGFLLLII